VSIINRRNAVMGYLAWVGAKTLLKGKARKAVPTIDTETKRPNKSAIALAVVSVLGVAAIWKRRTGNDTPVTPAT
jgi:hypothetical protein